MPDTKLSKADRQYLDGYLDFLMWHSGMPDGARDQACIEAIEESERFRGRNATQVFYAWLTEE